MARKSHIDWEKVDPMIRAGILSPTDIADEAGCTVCSIYQRRAKFGIERRQYKRRGGHVTGHTNDGVFNYWGWLKGEIKRLGKAEVIRQYGH